MANISKLKREKMLTFLSELREQYEDNSTILTINDIELELTKSKYGLVWEEHEERVDIEMETKVPVFSELKDREITKDNSLPYNFLLEGDNLHSLYLLEKTHKNLVDVIYIDPPYNRGKDDFIYDDKYVDLEDAFKHSKWLSFMSKRLNIAYNLLNPEGVIFISIDDNEVSQLKILCDSIFGDMNCIGTIIQNKLNSKNDTINIQKNHEYILVYRKQCNYINGDEKKVKPTLIKNAYKVKNVIEENGEYYYLNDAITTRGEGGTLNARKNLGYTVYYNPITKDKKAVCDYDIELAKTSNDEKELYSDDEDLISQGYIPIRPPRVRGKLGCWTWDLNKFNRDKHFIAITKNSRSKSYSVKKRTFVKESEVYKKDGKLYYNAYSKSNSKSIIEYSTNDGTTQLNNILGESGLFNNPKNVEMIKYFISLYPKKDALVLDFFAGSGTTGQAVLELNKSDGGDRRFILCTNNQNKICENITYRRIGNVINGYKYKGKKEHVLYEKTLKFRDLLNIDSIIEDIEVIEENYKNNFISLKKEFKENTIKIIGKETIDEFVDGIPANLIYYKTHYINKIVDDVEGLYTDEFLSHIVEMVQLEHAVKIDNSNYAIILTDEDADRFEQNEDSIKQCKAIYISSKVLLTKNQRTIFDRLNIEMIYIPEYYFDKELRDMGELCLC